MARKGRISIQKLLNEGSDAFRRLNQTRVDAALAGSPAPNTQLHEQRPLERPQARPHGMVDIPGPLHCRITRVYGPAGKPYDDDNLSGGCKECRDAIAAMLGLEGDSESDGITWTYEQRQGAEPATIIEVYTR
jgi:hypothetical protein